MDSTTELFKMLAALVFVVSLMGGLALVMKKLGLGGPIMPSVKQSRLKIIEALPLDGRRKLVLLRRDDMEHLVILGATSETVIETQIAAKDNESHE
jgi:flagellar protein FliO/FliZ